MDLLTEKELDTKYDPETPWWRKDELEWYTCERHNRPVVFLRDKDKVFHTNTNDVCS